MGRHSTPKTNVKTDAETKSQIIEQIRKLDERARKNEKSVAEHLKSKPDFEMSEEFKDTFDGSKLKAEVRNEMSDDTNRSIEERNPRVASILACETNEMQDLVDDVCQMNELECWIVSSTHSPKTSSHTDQSSAHVL